MKDTTLDDIIEAALLAAGEPLPVERWKRYFWPMSALPAKR